MSIMYSYGEKGNFNIQFLSAGAGEHGVSDVLIMKYFDEEFIFSETTPWDHVGAAKREKMDNIVKVMKEFVTEYEERNSFRTRIIKREAE